MKVKHNGHLVSLDSLIDAIANEYNTSWDKDEDEMNENDVALNKDWVDLCGVYPVWGNFCHYSLCENEVKMCVVIRKIMLETGFNANDLITIVNDI